MVPMQEKSEMQPQVNPPPYAQPYPQQVNQPPPYIQQPYGSQVIHATVVPSVVPTVVPMIVGRQMDSKPTVYTCKSCNLEIVTRVEEKSTTRTHLFAALLCLFGCWPCVFIPYCTSSCKNIDHYCPNCSAYIGSYNN